MKIADALLGVTGLFLDTAPVIYYVEKNPVYTATVVPIFERMTLALSLRLCRL